MFGSLISSAIKAVTLPVAAAAVALDVVTGGDGSKKSRTDDMSMNLFGELEKN